MNFPSYPYISRHYYALLSSKVCPTIFLLFKFMPCDYFMIERWEIFYPNNSCPSKSKLHKFKIRTTRSQKSYIWIDKQSNCIWYHSSVLIVGLLICRRLYSPSSRPPWRRTWFIILASILIFVLVIYVMATLGRSSTEVDDPFMQNHQ